MQKLKTGSIVVNSSDLQQGNTVDAIKDRSIHLHSDDPISWDGSNLVFTQPIDLISQDDNGSFTSFNRFSVGTSPLVLANDSSIVVRVDRSAGTHVLTLGTYPTLTAGQYAIVANSSISGLAAITNGTKDFYVIATRRDSPSTGDQDLVLPLNKQLLSPGQTTKLGASGSGSGSGSGGNGFNVIGLDPTFTKINTNDRDAENSVGNWLAYQNTAGVAPTTMTGGSPVTTVTRTTTVGEALNGKASFKITKDAANRQGEGVSVLTNIPLGYRGSQMLISIPFKTISGTLVQGDLKLYVYDVANALVVTPFNNEVVGGQGILKSTFPIAANTTQIRVGFHFASTSATAVTLSFDDVFVGTSDDAIGPNFTDYVLNTGFTLPSAAFGTVTNTTIFTKEAGDELLVEGAFITGTVGASLADLILPTNIVIDVTKLTALTQSAFLGEFTAQTTGGAVGVYTSMVGGVISFNAGMPDRVFFGISSSTNSYSHGNGNQVFTNNQTVTFKFRIPVVNQSSNLTIAASSTFKASSFLANGTRITGTPPTLLGQYRSYLRISNTTTFSEVNASPTNPPNSLDGIRMDAAALYASSDSNGFPSRYDVFVGNNKNVKLEFYKNQGRTGFISIDAGYFESTFNIGAIYNYDPTTGILQIQGNTGNAASNNSLGSTDNGGIANTIYFDIVVSENALAVGFKTPRSQIRLAGASGSGSVGTSVRVFTNIIENTGNAITYTSDSTNGDFFTIKEDGVYSMHYKDGSQSPEVFGFSKNASSNITSIGGLPQDQQLMSVESSVGSSGAFPVVSYTGFLPLGTIIRPHTNGGQTATSQSDIKFAICKVSN